MTAYVQLSKLIDEYGSSNIRSALIQHWAKYSNIKLNTFSSSSITQKFVENANEKDVCFLLKQFKVLFPKLTLKDVEQSFELTLDKESRKSFGMVYTPEYIIDYLTKNSLSFTSQSAKVDLKVCDPACGSGGFLIRFADILQKDFGISGERAFQNHIIGIDIDSQALEQAKCLIELYLVEKKQAIPNLKNTLFQLDTLTTDTAKIFSLANVAEGFDVLVTNPPYVKFQNLDAKYREMLNALYSQFTRGNFSLSSLFLIRGFELLSSNGSLGMITQNNLFTSLAGKHVREYLQSHESIQRIVDFGHHKVFSNASAYTCLIFLGKGGNKEFDYSRFDNKNKRNLTGLQKLEFSKIKLSRLNPNKWRLAKNYHLENLEKIEKIGHPLKQVADIRVGFATLKDSVFFVRKSNDLCFATTQEGCVFQIECGVTRPAVKVSEMNNVVDLVQNNRRIIFPYEKIDNSYRILSEEHLRNHFPKTYSYLLENRELLGSRDKGKKKYQAWFAWARTQGMDSLGPKLLTKTFSKSPNFLLDQSDQLFCNGYSVSPKPKTLFDKALSIQFLEKILNSDVMHYYAKLTSFQIEGGYQCYQKNFIEKFGVPNLSDDQIIKISALNQTEANQEILNVYDLNKEEVLEILSRD